MSSLDLQRLLSRFVADGDQAAFADVVRQCGPLVWRVAMRRLGDPQLAEEAAQNVFVALARKAPVLVQRPGLVAWLHRAATLEASTLARSRRRRAQRLNPMNHDLTPQDPGDPATPPAGPWLDEAIDRLSPDERTLILGRYYEGRSLRELAQDLGKSEDAAKKQAQRALAKLEVWLRRRGIGVTGVALSSLLGSELSPAAVPGSVTASLVASSLQTLGTAATQPSILTCLAAAMSTTKSTAIATAVLLALLAASLHQKQVNAALRLDGALSPPVTPVSADSLAASATPAAPSPQSTSSTEPSTPRLPYPLDAPSLLRAMARSAPSVAGLYDPGPDMGEAQRVIESMSVDERWTLWRALESAQANPTLLRMAREFVLLHLVKHDPQRVLDLAVDGRFSGHTQAYMQTWAAEDPDAAWGWLRQADADGRLLRTRAAGEAPEDVLRRGFAEGLAQRQLSEAIDFTRRHLTEEGAEWLVAGTGAVLMKKNQPTQLLELAAGLPTDQARQRALVDAARAPFDPFDVTWGTRHVTPLLDHADFPQNLRQSVLRETAATAYGDSVWPSLLLMHQASPPDQRAENLAWLVDRFSKERASQIAGSITLANPDEQRALDDALAATASALADRGNARLAREFADKVRNPDLRTQTQSSLSR